MSSARKRFGFAVKQLVVYTALSSRLKQFVTVVYSGDDMRCDIAPACRRIWVAETGACIAATF